ncbi:MAG: hypothetical protein ACLU3F_00085 [Blautia wexlerae]
MQDPKAATAEIVNTRTYDIVLPPTGIQGTAAPLAAVFVILCGAGTGYLSFSGGENRLLKECGSRIRDNGIL